MNVLDELKRHVRGELVERTSESFVDRSRIFNVLHQHTPLCVVRCLDTADVVSVLRITAQHGVPVTVRSGGHGIGGQAVGEGAVVIDLRGLDSITLDETSGMVTIGGGVTSRAFNGFLWERGRCASTGFEPTVGVSGLLLGGGYGVGVRRFGLACDALADAEVVLADGSVVTTDAIREPDLFWALRGAGAHFGVVTRMTIRSYPLPRLVTSEACYSIEHAPQVLAGFRDLLPSLGRDTMLYLMMANDPEEGAVVQTLGMHFGDDESAKKALRPSMSFAHPLVKRLGEQSFEDIHEVGEGQLPTGHCNAWASDFFDMESRGVACDALERLATELEPRHWVVLEHLGGALADLGPTDTAFPHRSTEVGLVTALRWKDPASPPTAALERQKAFHASLRTKSLGEYANYIADAQFDRAFGVNLPRLRTLKAKFDPHGRFGSTFLA